MRAKYYLTISLMIGVMSCHSGSKGKGVESSDSVKSQVGSKADIKNNAGKEDLKGVLILHTDSADISKSAFSVLNFNKSVYTKIRSVDDNEPSSDKLKNKILAYYPEYYIVHFNADVFSGSLYSVKIGSDVKLIQKGQYMEYLSWPDYILRFFAITTKANPLRSEPKTSGKIITDVDYSKLSFRCIEISGDWVKVVCNKDCEGCLNGKEITGWIRWRENNKVILKQYYTC